MLRSTLVTALGLVAGNVVIAALQGLNSLLFPPPPGMDYTDPAVAARLIREMPVGAFVGLELSYALGSLCAGLVLGRFLVSRHTALALAVGALFTAANLANLMQIPHPLWLAVLTTITFVPMTWLGRWVLGPRTPAA